MITGHGSFHEHLIRFGIAGNAECHRRTEARTWTKSNVYEQIKIENIIQILLQNKSQWNSITGMVVEGRPRKRSKMKRR